MEGQMILSQKEAIELLIASASDIGFNRYTVLNLHALLADNLLIDPSASGRLRRIPVGIDHTVFMPVRQCMTKPQAIGHVRDIALQSLPASDQSGFVEVVHDQLMNLHEGNMARYRLRPSEFVAWQREWEE